MPNETLFKLIIELLVAISHYLWPIVVFIIALIFRKPLADLLGRVRKGKLFGQELELDPMVIEFRQTVLQAENEILQLPSSVESTSDPLKQESNKAFAAEARFIDDEINKILDDSRVDPGLAIIRLSAIIDRELRELIASTGWMPPHGKANIAEAIQILDSKGVLPKNAFGSLKIFRDLRNKIVHGYAADQHQTLQVLDSGITLLKLIRAIPYEIHTVNGIVDLYEDKACTKLVNNAKGLILESTSPNGSFKYRRIFPTTKGNYYQKGKRVSWEWNQLNSWKETWYVNPEDGNKKHAWSESNEFVGKHLDEI